MFGLDERIAALGSGEAFLLVVAVAVLLGMGASAGLIPCPSALVVLLAAIAQHQVALGLLMIVAFSLGLAGTLSALGLLVVLGGRMASRLRVPPAFGAALPAVSAVVIVAAGFVLTVRALPHQLT